MAHMSMAGRPAPSDTALLSMVSAVGSFIWRIPQRILIGLLIAYRAVVSPLYGQVCRFFPSCSAYALEAVTVYGAVRGSYLAVRRLMRCHPWNLGGVDHVPENGKAWGASGEPRIIMLNHPERYLDCVIPASGDDGGETVTTRGNREN